MPRTAATTNAKPARTKPAVAPRITHLDLAVPTKRERPFSDPGWVYELKHDGYRVLATKEGAQVRLLSRRGNALTHWFPELTAELARLPDLVLDGELVMLDERGRSEFDRLRGRCAMRDARRIEHAARTRPAAIFAFDLLVLEGADLRPQPLLKRKAALQRILKSTRGERRRICYCQHVGENGERLFVEADRLALEGIVAKRADSPYPRGRTLNWVKIKTLHGRHIDASRASWNR
jgi:bifunctional non-homologous end joining protein LigD